MPGSTQKVATDFWLAGRRQGNLEYGDRWVTDMTPYPNDKALYTRTVTLEQFQITRPDDHGVCDGTGSAGRTNVRRVATGTVQFKRYHHGRRQHPNRPRGPGDHVPRHHHPVLLTGRSDADGNPTNAGRGRLLAARAAPGDAHRDRGAGRRRHGLRPPQPDGRDPDPGDRPPAVAAHLAVRHRPAGAHGRARRPARRTCTRRRCSIPAPRFRRSAARRSKCATTSPTPPTATSRAATRDSPKALDGTDILTVRGCFANSVYQLQPNAFVPVDSDNDQRLRRQRHLHDQRSERRRDPPTARHADRAARGRQLRRPR